MQRLSFLRETLCRARAEPLWGAAFAAALLLPWMMILAKVGMEACCAVIGLSFLWVSFRRREWAWLKQPFAIACIVAWVWLTLVATPFALFPERALVPALMWFRFPLMVIALRYYVLDTAAARTVLGGALALLLCLLVMDSLWQYLTGISLSGRPRLDTGRLTGPFTTPKIGLFIGKLILPVTAYGLLHALKRHSMRGGMLLVVFLFGVLITILLSGERSAALSTLFGFGIAALLMMLAEKRWRMPCLIAGALAAGSLVYLYETNNWIHLRAQQSFETMLNYGQSDYGQLAKAGYDIGMANILTGAGLGGFRELCPDLPYNGYMFKGMHPHNAYAEWFAETGLPGLLIFLAIIATLLRDGVQQFRRASGLERVLPAMAIGVVAQHFFPLMGMQSFFTNWPAMLLWYPLGLAFAGLPKEKRP